MYRLGAVTNRPMLMQQRHIFELANQLQDFRAGVNMQNASAHRGIQTFGSVAIIPMIGPIFHRGSMFADFFGLRSLQWLKAAMREAVGNSEITAIVQDWDSPGGEVDGTPETAAELFKMRGEKPIIAVANTMMSSAAYWLACQADEIVVSPSSLCGSVGVWVLHQDFSRMLDEAGITSTFIFAGDRKVDANPLEPLGDEARADLDNEVRTIHEQFLASCAKARGITPAAARKAFGDGRSFMSKDAVRVGLADREGTLDEVLTKLTRQPRTSRRRAATAYAEEHLPLSVFSAHDIRTIEEFGETGPAENDRSHEAAVYRAAREVLDAVTRSQQGNNRVDDGRQPAAPASAGGSDNRMRLVVDEVHEHPIGDNPLKNVKPAAARVLKTVKAEDCSTCGGSGLKPEGYMGDPQGQEDCPDCGGDGQAAATEERRKARDRDIARMTDVLAQG